MAGDRPSNRNHIPAHNNYYRARHYSPELRRFIQRDPLEYVDGPCATVYAHCLPTRFIDPLGLYFDDETYKEGIVEKKRHVEYGDWEFFYEIGGEWQNDGDERTSDEGARVRHEQDQYRIIETTWRRNVTETIRWYFISTRRGTDLEKDGIFFQHSVFGAVTGIVQGDEFGLADGAEVAAPFAHVVEHPAAEALGALALALDVAALVELVGTTISDVSNGNTSASDRVFSGSKSRSYIELSTTRSRQTQTLVWYTSKGGSEDNAEPPKNPANPPGGAVPPANTPPLRTPGDDWDLRLGGLDRRAHAEPLAVRQ